MNENILYDVMIYMDIEQEVDVDAFLSFVVSVLIAVMNNCTQLLAVKIVTELSQNKKALIHSSHDMNESVKIRDLMLSHGIQSDIHLVDCSTPKRN